MEDTFVHANLYRSKITTLFSDAPFSGSGVGVTRNSSSIVTTGYREFVLYLDIDSTGTPTDIVFQVQFSDDDSNWYNYQNDFWGDLRYEDTATAAGVKESLNGVCVGSYFRLRAVETGTSGTAYFKVTSKVEFRD